MSISSGLVFDLHCPIGVAPSASADKSRYQHVLTDTAITRTKLASGLQVPTFNGTNGKIACGNIGLGKTISFWIDLDSTTEAIMEESAAAGIEVSGGTLSYTNWDNAYVNAVDTNTLAATWSHVVIVSTTDVAMSAFTIGLLDATYSDSEMALVTVWNRTLSHGEIVQQYESQKHLFV